MSSLNWKGKEEISNYHLKVPVWNLKKQYKFFCQDENLANSYENMLIKGDNLIALKTLLPKFKGKINYVYIDPPYNTGNEKWIYNDNANNDKINKWLSEAIGKECHDFSKHDKWLCMMFPRLQLLKELLTNTGVIFISIDDNELFNLKLLCDEVFGEENFIGMYSWYKSATPSNLSKKIKKNLEYILCYQKQKTNQKFKGMIPQKRSSNGLLNQTNVLGVLNFPANVVTTKIKDKVIKKGVYGTDRYKIELLEDTEVKDGVFIKNVLLKGKFKWSQAYLNEQIDKGTKIIIQTERLSPSYEKAEYDADTPSNFINEKFGVGTTENAGVELINILGNNNFNYPKPVSLIKYLIDFTNNPNAIVLDCFLGSGTTAQAVLELNAQDNGNRKFIGIEEMDYIEDIAATRIRKVIDGYGEKLKEVKGLGGGFTFYNLDGEIDVNKNTSN